MFCAHSCSIVGLADITTSVKSQMWFSDVLDGL